ncbi:MAG TPA: hypothetical protein VMH88_08120 [Gemmatimonadales bacterium]|nr:hypothetical protein [Gemmatimonadales bacterium]
MNGPDFQRLAEIAVDQVTPEPHGFTLVGQGGGADRAEYRLDVHFDVPLDARTRAVLGELLSQSELTISRRLPPSLPAPAGRRERAHKSSGRHVTAD